MLLCSIELLHEVDRTMIIADRNDFAHLALVTCLIASASVADNRLTDFLVDQLKLRQLIVSAQDT